jgi:hypothetical protein
MQAVITNLCKKINGSQVEFCPEEESIVRRLIEAELSSVKSCQDYISSISISFGPSDPTKKTVYEAQIGTIANPEHMQCLGCKNFHGQDGVVCGIHPHGPSSDTCEDIDHE